MRLFWIALLFPVAAAAQQDLIVKTNGDSIRCRITDLSNNRITFIDSGNNIHAVQQDSITSHRLGYFDTIKIKERKIKSENHEIKIVNQRVTGSVMIAAGGLLLAVHSAFNTSDNPWSPTTSRVANAASGVLIAAGGIIMADTWRRNKVSAAINIRSDRVSLAFNF